MSKLNDNQRECAAIITAMIEGGFSPAQRERLNELCRVDASCREMYLSVMSVHGMLMWTHDFSTHKIEEEADEPSTFIRDIYEQARIDRIKHDAELALLKDQQQQRQDEALRLAAVEEPIEPKPPRVIIIPRLLVYGSLAAAILLTAVLVWPLFESAGPTAQPDIVEVVPEVLPEVLPKAQLVRSDAAVWGQSIRPDGVLEGDQAWSLNSGFAEIAMPSGASVILHGPTTFRLIDDNALALDDGRLSADVPDRAKYFTVKTRAMDVVDLGTRFGVTIEPDGAASASVFQGKVEAHEPKQDKTDRVPRVVALTAGQAVRADKRGRLDASATAMKPDHGYIDRWDAIARQVRIQGQARFFNTPPTSVRPDELLETGRMIVFEESAIVLDQPIRAMANLPEKKYATFNDIPAGQRVVSYFIHNAPNADDKSSFATATLTFPGRILGVIGNTKDLRQANTLFGLDAVSYVPLDDTSEDFSTHGIDPGSPDHFSIGGLQGNTLTIHLAAGKFGDQVRVLVEVPDTSVGELKD